MLNYPDDFDYEPDCHSVGMSGNCGLDCPVFKGGLCEVANEIEPKDIIKYFGEYEDFMLENYPEWCI